MAANRMVATQADKGGRVSKLKLCPKCGGLVPGRAGRCPHCHFSPDSVSRAVALGLTAAVGFGVLAANGCCLAEAYGACTLPDGNFCSEEIQPAVDAGPDAGRPDGGTADGGDAG
jgi:ribosomal protein L40E